MPAVKGHTRINIGRQVRILGKIGIASGRMFDEPTLRIGDSVKIGHDVRFSVNREVSVEDGVFIAGQATIADNDGHPHDPNLRLEGEPPAPADCRPVRICRKAWIGQGAQIRKGVTVGEGAIVGVNSVVVKDVPAHSIVLGAPARVTGFVRKACSLPQAQSSCHRGRAM